MSLAWEGDPVGVEYECRRCGASMSIDQDLCTACQKFNEMKAAADRMNRRKDYARLHKKPLIEWSNAQLADVWTATQDEHDRYAELADEQLDELHPEWRCPPRE